MQGIYGHIWTSRWPVPEALQVAKNEWHNDLAKYSDEELDAAVERSKARYKMPPNLAEFLECCIPDFAELGMPDPEAAYLEACQKSHDPNNQGFRWSHPAVYFAGKQAGWHDLQRTLSGVRTRFDSAYEVLFRQVVSGAQLEIPKPNSRTLEHKGGEKTRTEQEKQTALTRIAELKAMLGMKQASPTESTGGTHGSM
ncbi:replication protein P [Oceanospirillum sediminis]|nr:replication protein P [Oceanospirillum sediminis]